jgi:hypothetical protein
VFWSQLKPHAETFEFVAHPEQDAFGIGALIHSVAMPVPAEFTAAP